MSRRSQLIELLGIADSRGMSQAFDAILDALRSVTPVAVSEESIWEAVNQATFGSWGSVPGNKIAGIKMYHTLTGSGLRESKEWVEKYIM